MPAGVPQHPCSPPPPRTADQRRRRGRDRDRRVPAVPEVAGPDRHSDNGRDMHGGGVPRRPAAARVPRPVFDGRPRYVRGGTRPRPALARLPPGGAEDEGKV